MRRPYRPGFALVLASVSILASVGVASGEESPAEVATRFVEALAGRDYDEVVTWVYEPWMYGELDSLCTSRPGVSEQDCEDCARRFGAHSLRDFIESPKERFFSEWARSKWPRLFPPEPTPPPSGDPPPREHWCATADVANRPLVESWSNLTVRTMDEVIEQPGAAFVVLDVRQRLSFRELHLEFALQQDGRGAWRIADVDIQLVSQ